MPVASYTKSGTKATTPVKLDKEIFAQEVDSHQLLKDIYLSYLAAGRTNNAISKSRGEIRGGGRKPWRQKGTGNARFGSSRNPIWRGGGVAFGPQGDENYSRKLNPKQKRQALRMSLSLAVKEDRLKIIETFACPDGKVKPTLDFLKKIGATGSILMVVSLKDELAARATRNIQNLKVSQAKYLNAHDVINADTVVISKKSLEIIEDWLKGSK